MKSEGHKLDSLYKIVHKNQVQMILGRQVTSKPKSGEPGTSWSSLVVEKGAMFKEMHKRR